MFKYRAIALTFLFTVISVCISFNANALQRPHDMAVDKRIKTVRYSPDEVFKFTGHYGYQSIIEFSPGEEILTVSVGDSVAWSFNLIDNRLFLKPIEPDATTNMTVITNHLQYHFELHAEEVEDITDKRLTFSLRFIYPGAYGAGFADSIDELDPAPDITDEETRAQLNFNYSMVGPEKISPLRIFDDGEFTYFQFKHTNADVPAFFVVDRNGDESIVNFRTRGDYIAVERVAPKFTLRYGSYVMCVFNESMRSDPPISPEDERTFFGKMVDFFKVI